MGRAHRGQSCTGATTPSERTSSTFGDDFGVAGLSSAVRELTATLIAGCPKPRDPSIASLRANVMQGMKRPVLHVMRLMYAGIDAGSSLESVTQWLDDAKALVTAYHARRERRQGLGVLPFDQLRKRVAVTAIKEECEADCSEQVMDENDIPSLERARTERLEAISAEQRKVDLITDRLAVLRLRMGK